MVAEFDFVSRGQVRGVVAPASWLRVDHTDARRGPAEVWEAWPECAAILDGPMWSNRRLDGTSGAAPLFRLLDTAGRVDVPSQRAGEGVTLSVVEGVASARRTDAVAPGASVAVQGWPPLIVEGEVVATDVGSNAERVGRAAWALMGDGRVGLFAARASAMRAFAVELRALGAVAAGYTDGGSSTYLRGRAAPFDPVTAPAPRVFAWLVLTPPGLRAPGSRGSGVWPVVAGVGALWLWLRGGR